MWLYKDSSGTRVPDGDAPNIGAHEPTSVGASSGVVTDKSATTLSGACLMLPRCGQHERLAGAVRLL
ncbi:MAG: hypothetical protein MZV70_03570 [Desulfobacterales bacterium]|nr:hypothetical protein [Desulfobacterales bacterium]